MLSDLLQPRLTELGKVKIGGLGDARTSKAGNSYRMPVKYDHFVITTLMRNKHGDLIADDQLMKDLASEGYGSNDGKLTEIPIVLMSDDIEDVIKCSYLWYQGKSLVGRSDGKTVTWFANPNTGERLPEPKEADWTPDLATRKDRIGNPLFKLHTTFNFVIASEHARWGGVYKFRTTSRISSEQLYGSLLQISQMTCGFLRGIPLRLRIRPLQVAPDGKPTIVYVVYVDIPAKSMLEIRQQALAMLESDLKTGNRLRQLAIEYKRILKAPGYDESDEEVAELQEEFHPDEPTPGVATASTNGKHAPPVADDPLMIGAAVPEPQQPEPTTSADDIPFGHGDDEDDAAAKDNAVNEFIEDCKARLMRSDSVSEIQALIDEVTANESWLGTAAAGNLRNTMRQALDGLAALAAPAKGGRR